MTKTNKIYYKGTCFSVEYYLDGDFYYDIDKGKEFIKDYDVDVIWYSNDDEIIMSDGFKYE